MFSTDPDAGGDGVVAVQHPCDESEHQAGRTLYDEVGMWGSADACLDVPVSVEFDDGLGQGSARGGAGRSGQL
jgi:hypothetical protein